MTKELGQIVSVCMMIGLQFMFNSLCAQEITLMLIKQEVSCAGVDDGRASVLPSGGESPYEYQWSNGETTQTIVNLSPGTYEITVTDANGLEAISAVGLFDVLPLEVKLIAEDGICGDLGKITAKVSGGLGPFQYNWSNGDFTSKITELQQGSYSVIVTDRNACPIEKSGDVIVHGDGLKLSTDFMIPSCAGRADGYISVSQTGGKLPVEYTWSNGSNETSIEDLKADTYSIFAKDDFGCTNGLVIILPDPDSLTVDILNQNNSLYADVQGGTPSYEYTWSNGVTGSSVISNLAEGDYGLTVEDANGCSDMATSEILAPLSNDHIENILSFSIQPTLVQSQLQINMMLEKAQKLSYHLLSSKGEMISTYSTTENNIQFSFPRMEELVPGIYIIKIVAEDGWIISEKFIKI